MEKKNKYAQIGHELCISNPLKRVIVWYGRTKLAVRVGPSHRFPLGSEQEPDVGAEWSTLT